METLTKQQKQVFDAVEYSMDNILVSGKPGVGKSVLIRALTTLGNKTYVLGAPTGLAANNITTDTALARTLHSIFRLPVSDGIIAPDFNNFTMDDRVLDMIKYNIKHLIIDEVSMVRADLFDFIDRLMRHAKGVNKPFGGAQVIIVGDFFQLPPVVRGAVEKTQLKECGYESEFVFSSRAFMEGNFKVMELTEVLRQKGDTKFLEILDAARTGDVTPKQAALLNKQVGQPNDLRIRLAAINKQADQLNMQMLANLPLPQRTYYAKKYGEWPALPAEEMLTLKVGAQIMVKMNGADRPPGLREKFDSQVVNGTLGIVKELQDDKVIITKEDGTEVNIYRQDWERKIKEKVADKWEERVVASFQQIPLALAWAISMHKSQGQSFEKVHVDPSRVFAPGQLYVALSRCRSLKGLSLASALNTRKFYANKDVLAFFESQEA